MKLVDEKVHGKWGYSKTHFFQRQSALSLYPHSSEPSNSPCHRLVYGFEAQKSLSKPDCLWVGHHFLNPCFLKTFFSIHICFEEDTLMILGKDEKIGVKPPAQGFGDHQFLNEVMWKTHHECRSCSERETMVCSTYLYTCIILYTPTYPENVMIWCHIFFVYPTHKIRRKIATIWGNLTPGMQDQRRSATARTPRRRKSFGGSETIQDLGF